MPMRRGQLATAEASTLRAVIGPDSLTARSVSRPAHVHVIGPERSRLLADDQAQGFSPSEDAVSEAFTGSGRASMVGSAQIAAISSCEPPTTVESQSISLTSAQV